eukprot:3402293-Pyramimonas_sp.AAC.1
MSPPFRVGGDNRKAFAIYVHGPRDPRKVVAARATLLQVHIWAVSTAGNAAVIPSPMLPPRLHVAPTSMPELDPPA